jgi:pilus assembly protein CpaB
MGLAWWALRGRERKAPEVVEIELPVPRNTIPANTDVRPEMFDTATFEVDKVPKDAIVDSQQLTDRITVRELEAGEPVAASSVIKRSISTALAYGIPENYRAMTVAVAEPNRVGNFIRPGDYIDIIALFTDTTGELSVAITILQDTLVLAVNSTTTPPSTPDEKKQQDEPKSRGDESHRLVTVGITPHEAQLLALSDFRGELRMTLRRTGDHGLEILPRSQSWSIVGSYPALGATQPNGSAASEQTTAGRGPDSVPDWARAWGMAPGQGAPGFDTGRIDPDTGKPVSEPGVKKPTVEVIRGFDRENVEPAQ